MIVNQNKNINSIETQNLSHATASIAYTLMNQNPVKKYILGR